MHFQFFKSERNIFRIFILLCGFADWIFLTACSNSNPVNQDTELVYPDITYDIDIPEPSGVCFGENYASLWIVSDTPHNKVYQTDLEGQILRKLDFTGNDLEGITFDAKNNVFWLAEEQLQEIVKISTNGQELDRIAVAVPKSGSNGIEGVALSESKGFWVVNEKNPVILAQIDSSGKEISVYDSALAKDYSDIFYDVTNKELWILSDESSLLIVWSPEFGEIKRYKLPFRKGEGVAVQPVTRQIFIVNDAQSTLSVFSLSANK